MEDYKEVFERRVRKGTRFTISYAAGLYRPWRVLYRGAGRYFRGLEAALAWCWGRGLIPAGEFDALEREISTEASRGGN